MLLNFTQILYVKPKFQLNYNSSVLKRPVLKTQYRETKAASNTKDPANRRESDKTLAAEKQPRKGDHTCTSIRGDRLKSQLHMTINKPMATSVKHK